LETAPFYYRILLVDTIKIKKASFILFQRHRKKWKEKIMKMSCKLINKNKNNDTESN